MPTTGSEPVVIPTLMTTCQKTIAITPTTGTGTAQATLFILANAGPKRTASVTVATRTITVNQITGCTYSVKGALHFSGAAQTSALDVTTKTNCPVGAATTRVVEGVFEPGVSRA